SKRRRATNRPSNREGADASPLTSYDAAMSAPATITELPVLPPRARDAHKGSFGRVLVVAGSCGMSGAAVLCASGALRGGAGLVTLAVPEAVLPIVAAANPCYMTRPLPQDGEGRLSSEALPDLLAAVRASTVTAL